MCALSRPKASTGLLRRSQLARDFAAFGPRVIDVNSVLMLDTTDSKQKLISCEAFVMACCDADKISFEERKPSYSPADTNFKCSCNQILRALVENAYYPQSY